MSMVRLAAILLALCLAACATAVIVPDADALGVKVTHNIAYGALSSSETMDLCQPTTGPTTNRRAVLLLHPGGFVSGDKTTLLLLCNNLASQGFVAATANYRLGNATTALADAQLAVRFMRSKAATYGLDANHLCAYGYSAGGVLANFLSFTTAAGGDTAALLSSYASKPDCAVLISGVFGVGGNPAVDPVVLADAATAPTYIVGGTMDDRQSKLAWNTAYYNRLQALGVTVKLALYAGGHIWQGAKPALRAQIEQDIVVWMKQR